MTTTPQTLTDDQRDLWGTYLADHASGARGALDRLRRMVQEYADLPHHADLVQLEEQITQERERVLEVAEHLGVQPSGLKSAVAAVGERVGRLKPNDRLTSRSPLAPLLEVELLRGGVHGKLCLWQTLVAHADELGLDAAEFAGRVDDARTQLGTLEDIHHTWRLTAFEA